MPSRRELVRLIACCAVVGPGLAMAQQRPPSLSPRLEGEHFRPPYSAPPRFWTAEHVRSSRIEGAGDSVTAIETHGYARAGDGGGAFYEYAAAEPPHAGKLRSIDGAWWELSVTQDIYVEMFGAKGDASRPADSTGPASGTDDTQAFLACRDFLQMKALQPNFYIGMHGGLTMNLRANRQYRITGDNVLGSGLARSTTSGDEGTYQRQNWTVDGHGSLLLWEPLAPDDALIQSYETLVRQRYMNFSVVGCNITGAKGYLYRNTANPGRNATAMHKFEFVQTALVGSTSAAGATHGFKGLFHYSGDNLGDRLQTEFCAFRQFHTGFYSENPEAVSQRFHRTTFATYIERAVLFDVRRHGSGFSTEGCELLLNGNRQILLRTRYLAKPTGTNQGHVIMKIEDSRLECDTDALFTLIDAEFGQIELRDVSGIPSGLPDDTSELLKVRGSATLTIENCHLPPGRVIVGQPVRENYALERAYMIHFDNCNFSMDLSKYIYAEDSHGSLHLYKHAIIGPVATLPIIVTNTNTRTAYWGGMEWDDRRYVFDGSYFGNDAPGAASRRDMIFIGSYDEGSGYAYLGTTEHVTLPACRTITSIRITHEALAADDVDGISVRIGSASLSITPLARERNAVELLGDRVVVISDDDPFERTIWTEVRRKGSRMADAKVRGFIEIELRQAVGLNEITTATVDGVRPTRLV